MSVSVRRSDVCSVPIGVHSAPSLPSLGHLWHLFLSQKICHLLKEKCGENTGRTLGQPVLTERFLSPSLCKLRFYKALYITCRAHMEASSCQREPQLIHYHWQHDMAVEQCVQLFFPIQFSRNTTWSLKGKIPRFYSVCSMLKWRWFPWHSRPVVGSIMPGSHFPQSPCGRGNQKELAESGALQAS